MRPLTKRELIQLTLNTHSNTVNKLSPLLSFRQRCDTHQRGRSVTVGPARCDSWGTRRGPRRNARGLVHFKRPGPFKVIISVQNHRVVTAATAVGFETVLPTALIISLPKRICVNADGGVPFADVQTEVEPPPLNRSPSEGGNHVNDGETEHAKVSAVGLSDPRCNWSGLKR
jgi:hypothetical protein